MISCQSHPHIPKATSQKPKATSQKPHPQQAIAHNPNFKRSLSQHSQTAIPTERFAITHNPLILNDRTPNLFLNFYHNQFSNSSPSILNKSESLETRIKSRTIAVAAIKMSASWIGVPLAFNLA